MDLQSKRLYQEYVNKHKNVKKWRLDQTVRYLDEALPVKFQKCKEYRDAVIASKDQYIVEATNNYVWGANVGHTTVLTRLELEVEKRKMKGRNIMGRIHIDHRPSFSKSNILIV